MDEIHERIRKNFRIAWRSIRFNPMRYLPFLLALFLIQSCLGIFITSQKKAEKLASGLYEEDCSYHLILNSVNDAQLSCLRTFSSQNTAAGLYRIYDERTAESSTMKDSRYNVKITFKEPVRESYEKFLRRYGSLLTDYGDGELNYTETPVLGGIASSSKSFTSGSIILFSLVAFALLNVIYGVRVNNERFEYGIYMTCGADFKKLVSGSFCENAILSLVSFIPSVAVSVTAVSLVFGSFCPVSFGDLILILVLTLAESTLSVLIPMRTVSSKYPLSLISSSDSSGDVVSPKRSADTLGKKLPFYGRLSLLRFRKYFVRVIISACAFSVIGLAVYYYGIVTEEKNGTEQPSFTVTLSDYYSYEDSDSAAVNALEGVTSTEKACGMTASYVGSHLAVGPGKVLPFSGCVPCHETNDTAYCTDLVSYRAADEEVLRSLERYDVAGSLSDGIKDGYCIICPNTFNMKRLDLKVGDVIRIAVGYEQDPESTVGAEELMLFSGSKLLRAKLDFYIYSYIEVRVAAVISDYPTGELMPVFFGHGTYEKAVGEYPFYTQLGVYTDEMTRSDAERFEKKLSSVLPKGALVLNTHSHVLARSDELAEKTLLLFILGALIVLFCPIVWFYSQSVFYSKRRGETQLLEFLGATEKEIRRLYLSDAVYVSVLSAVSTAVLSFAAVSLTYRLLATLASSSIFYHFDPPVLLITIISLISASCSLLSVLVCFMRRKTAESHAESALFDDSSR